MAGEPWKRVKQTPATNSGTGLSLAFDEPVAVDATHTLALVVSASGGAAPSTPPDGWTLAAGSAAFGSSLWLGLYLRQGDGVVNGASMTFGASQTQMAATLFAFEGFVTLALDSTPTATNNGSATTQVVGPAAATTAEKTIHIGAVGLQSGGGGTWQSFTGGFTSVPISQSRMHIGVKAETVVGATPQTSVAWSSSRGSRDIMWTLQGVAPAANASPVVNVGADRKMLVGDTLTLTAAATDADGTISSIGWSVVACDTTPPALAYPAETVVWSADLETASPFTNGPATLDSLTNTVAHSGASSLYCAGSSNLAHRVRYVSQAFAAGSTLRGWVRLGAGSPRLAGVAFVFPDTTDSVVALIDSRNSTASSAGFQISENRPAGSGWTTGVVPSEPIQAERWYLIEASYVGATVTARLYRDDGVQIATVERAMQSLTLPATYRAGVFSYGDTWHDDIAVSIPNTNATVAVKPDRPMTLTLRATALDNAGASGSDDVVVRVSIDRGLPTDRGALRRKRLGARSRAAKYRGRSTDLGKIAEWTFAEASGPFYSTDGALPLVAAGSVPRVASPWGYAVDIDGSYLRIPAENTSALDVGDWTGQVTVAAWVNRQDTNTGFVAGVWQEDGADPRRQYGLFIDLGMYGGAQQSCFHISKTGGPTPGYPFSKDYSASGATVANDVWQFHVGTYDGAEIRSYLNGAFTPVPTYTDGDGQTYAKNPYAYPDGLNSVLTDFTVGAVRLSSGWGNYFDGQVARLRVWNRALRPDEVAALYAEERVALG